MPANGQLKHRVTPYKQYLSDPYYTKPSQSLETETALINTAEILEKRDMGTIYFVASYRFFPLPF